jgi:hypothetical protein
MVWSGADAAMERTPPDPLGTALAADGTARLAFRCRPVELASWSTR